MKILHNPRCSKSRQTLQLLNDNGVEPEIIEYLTNPISEKELKAILELLGKDAKDILRKGEKDFKEHFKGKELSNDEWIKAMIEYPKLMERPIVYNDKNGVLGRPPENVLDII